MHVRAQNPAPWVPWLVTATLAGVGVGGLLLGRRAAAAVEGNGNGNGGGPPMLIAHAASIPAGGAAGATAADQEAMRSGSSAGVFTSFFTSDVQQMVISRMVAYRNDRGISSCKAKTMSFNDPVVGFLDRTMWRVEAEDATRQVLQSLWPNGAPWQGEQFWEIEDAAQAEETVALWRWWLWRRVMRLADEHVCLYIPIN